MGVFERSTFQIVVTCFLLGTFAPACVAGETPLPACQGKHEGKVTDKSITRRYDQGVGFNPSQYIIQSYTSSPWPATSADLEKRREKFETEKLKEFVRTRGAAMLDAPAVVDLLERNGLSVTGRSGDTALRTADAIVLAPSNPLVSIAPILAVRGVRRALVHRRAPAAAVSPLVGGRPVKGPLHRMLRGLGLDVSPLGVARLYRQLVDVFVLDHEDARWAPRIAALGIRPVVTETLMRTPTHAARLAAAVLAALGTR